jgi:hypothetical protein
VSGPLEDWLLYKEVALILMVSPKRLMNLVSLHKLARRAQWIGRGRQRRRLTRLPPETVRRLAELTGRGYLIRR